MPNMGLYAQRVRYPNGLTSAPFIVPHPKMEMVAFATEILEGIWPGNIGPDRKFQEPSPRARARGSCRIDCVDDCRFWDTLERWTRQYIDGVGLIGLRERPDGCLSAGEMLPLFPMARHAASPWPTDAWGIADPHRAIALTTLKWAAVIEEWR